MNEERVKSIIGDFAKVVGRDITEVPDNELSKGQIAAKKAWITMRERKAAGLPPLNKNKPKVVKHKPEIDLPESITKPTDTISPITKAWQKRRVGRPTNAERGLPSHVKNRPVTYDRPGKNKFRDIVVGYFENRRGSVLALESHEMLFVKALPQHSFILWEHDLDTYNKIKNSRMGNVVSIEHGDISNARSIQYNYAFLDFCNTYKSNVECLKKLVPKLVDTEIIAFTFAARPGKLSKDELANKEDIEMSIGDYKVDLVRKLQEIFYNHTVERSFSYRDGTQMVGFIFKKKYSGVAYG